MLQVPAAAVTWFGGFPLPVLRDFAGHVIDADEMGAYKLMRAFEKHEEACTTGEIVRATPSAWAFAHALFFDADNGPCKPPMPGDVELYSASVLAALLPADE
jgi:hypothetical protein